MMNLRPILHSHTLRGIGAAALLGAAALTLTACASADTVADTSWGKLDTRGEASMTFTAQGSVHGSDGCNVVNGTWTEDQGTITFGPLATTMMYCEGVDTWLSGATTAVAKGDTITFSDAEGTEIGTLTKTKFVSPE